VKQFDWDGFKKAKFYVRCRTENEAKSFCEQMHLQGLRWRNGVYLLTDHTNYNHYNSNTVYSCRFERGSECVEYGHSDFQLRAGCIVKNWEDYVQKKFTKADLRTGDIVQCRNGKVMRVMLNTVEGSVLIAKNLKRSLSDYCTGLTHAHQADLNIENVYRLNKLRNFTVCVEQNLDMSFAESDYIHLWQRENPTVKISKDEAFRVLKEYYGARVEMTE